MKDIILYLVLAINIIVVALCGIMLVLTRKKQDSQSDNEMILDNLSDIYKLLEKQIEQVESNIRSAINASNTVFMSTVTPFLEQNTNNAQKLNATMLEQLGKMREEIDTKLDLMRRDTRDTLKEVRDEMKESVGQMRKDIDKNLDQVRQDNTSQLDKMRETVDEKLNSTLNQRINEAFKTVNERLDSVQKGFGEMAQLSAQVGDLNKSFNNIKSRGTWGEVALESLLEQILSPEQYKKQHSVKNKNERVDFAICMPSGVLLPIDCKFPMEDYERLQNATNQGTVEEIRLHTKALKDTIKGFAKDISAKYINIPKTTDFAILYLPTEGLYSEIIKDGELVSELQSKFKILVCGPTTITALLNSLQVGFTTLKIQKQSGEIADLLIKFKKDFNMFTGFIGKAKDNAEKMVKNLDDATKRNDLILRKLDKVSKYDVEISQPDQAIMIELDEE